MVRQLEKAHDVLDYPTEYDRRICTDVFCVYIGLIFSILMVVIGVIMFNYDNFSKVNFPADSNGANCGIDHPAYPFVYFVDPPHMNRRVCVKQCPNEGDQQLSCIPTDSIGCRFSTSPLFQVRYYSNKPQQTRSGNFCFPTDPTLKQQLLQNSNLTDRDAFFNSLDTIVLCFIVAFAVSVAYMCLVQCLPKILNYAAVGLGCIIILVCSVCVFLYRTSQHTAKLAIGIVLIVVLVIILLTLCKNMDSWRMHGIFLQYSTKMISDRCSTLLYIPIFFLCLVGFVAMLVLEFTAYWSFGTVTFNPDTTVFHEIQSPTAVLMSVILIVQALWGLTFIKQAFNFCVSGQAVNWYFEKEELGFCYVLRLLLCKHLGSVISGAFITGFLSVEDFVFDFVKPDENANPDGCYTGCYNFVCRPCISLFDLVRSDAMAFINMTGNPFCNSARYCEYLCDRSIIMDYSQSTSRAYRICAHFLITGLMAIFGLYIKGNISIYALLVIMVETLFISTLFISVHADATEAIQIIFLTDEEFNRQRREDHHDYNPENIDANLTTQLKDDLANDVKMERKKQKEKREGSNQ